MEAVKNRVLWHGTACVTMRYIPSRDLVDHVTLGTSYQIREETHPGGVLWAESQIKEESSTTKYG